MKLHVTISIEIVYVETEKEAILCILLFETNSISHQRKIFEFCKSVIAFEISERPIHEQKWHGKYLPIPHVSNLRNSS